MDFGCLTTLIKEKLRNCDAIVIESNHSRDMLRACPIYRWDLKQRILSRTGHLSNEDLCEWLTDDSTARRGTSFSRIFRSAPTNRIWPA